MNLSKIIWILTLILTSLIGLFILLIIATNLIKKPSLDRNWNSDQAYQSTADFLDENLIQINNIRSFRYQSEKDYTENYTSETLNLADLTSIDYILVPLGSPGAAHAFLSFGFSNSTTNLNKHISISVEIRKEQGESFSALKGLFANYELMYVIADEADLIDLRARHRQNDIYMYQVKTSPQKMQELLVSMLKKANQLNQTPEFYNTLTNNCSLNIKKHINLISEKRIPFDYRAILPEKSDQLGYNLGLFDTTFDFETLKQNSNITERARQLTGLEPNYSQLLRTPIQ